MAVPKWTDERTQSLVDFVGSGPVSQATVAEAADELETSSRSVSSKLRKMGYEVELASASQSNLSQRIKSLLLQTLFKITAVSIHMLKSQRTLKAEHSVLSQFKVKSFPCS
tara:strand:+ start:768 stop:1100 length:333 start_codon:yes stop_codon:yes gene_type:complete